MATKIVTKNSSTASAVPTASDLVQGELAVNVADKRLYTEDNGGAIVELGTNPSTLTVTGEITANGGIALGDNDKATFGASDDLQIYHTGSDSRILDEGTGNLRIMANNLRMQSALGEQYIIADDGGAVTAYYDNAAKLATTSTGINVTGSVTADTGEITRLGLGAAAHASAALLIDTTDQHMRLTNGSELGVIELDSGGDLNIWAHGDGETINLKTGSGAGTDVLSVVGGNVGIGTSSPVNYSGYTTTTIGGTSGGILTFTSGGTQNSYFAGEANGLVISAEGARYTKFHTNGVERMRIDSSGRVGIGTSSPTSPLHIKSATDVNVRFDDSGSSSYTWYMNDAQNLYIPNVQLASTHTFYANGQRKVDIDSSGRVGIGISSMVNPLHVGVTPNTASKTSGSAFDGGALRLDGNLANAGDESAILAGSNDGLSAGIGFMRESGANWGTALKFYTHSPAITTTDELTERMRIDSSGNLLVGTTSPSSFQNNNSFVLRTSVGDAVINHVNGTVTGSGYLAFGYNGGRIGYISQSGTTAVLYNTSSDERLKENIADADDAGSKIDAIQVRKYDWKADGSHQDYGMIAQELLEVAPEAVSVPEDSEEMMGVDYSKLVPMLIKEIQSLRNRVAQLEE